MIFGIQLMRRQVLAFKKKALAGHSPFKEPR